MDQRGLMAAATGIWSRRTSVGALFLLHDVRGRTKPIDRRGL